MDLILNKPYKLIWFSILLTLSLLLFKPNTGLDIQMHDTFFVISSFHIGSMLSIILGIIGAFYWLMRDKVLINWMTIFHVATTIITLLFILAIVTNFIELKILALNDLRSLKKSLFILIFITIVSQVIFLLNIVISIRRNNLKNRP